MRVALAPAPASAPVCEVIRPNHHDLHSCPAAIDRIEPARSHPPLRSFLINLNAQDSLFATFASKVWCASDHGNAEPCVFASRVDLIFLCEATNFGRGPLDDLARRLAQLLEREPNAAAWAELRVAGAELAGDNEGYCLQFSLFARGATPEQAEMRWGLGMAGAQQALLFVARILRQHAEPAGS